MKYNYCGNSGLKLPAISLGFWHNFGDAANYKNCEEMVLKAFDLGITHFDLANNYGPKPGAAEEMFGRILHKGFKSHRDEMVIATKAGFDMWDGPYGIGGSKKYLIASLDQSLKRMGLDYVDIFYHHCPDNDTPMEETAEALTQVVRNGKALYVGISNYNPEQTKKMSDILAKNNVHCLIHQVCYNIGHRIPEENGLDKVVKKEGMGLIAFCPLGGGILTDRYLNGIPEDSRAVSESRFLNVEQITPELVEMLNKMNEVAKSRGQSIAQMSLSWLIQEGKATSALIGASRPSQVIDCAKAAENTTFTADELKLLDNILGQNKK